MVLQVHGKKMKQGHYGRHAFHYDWKPQNAVLANRCDADNLSEFV